MAGTISAKIMLKKRCWFHKEQFDQAVVELQNAVNDLVEVII